MAHCPGGANDIPATSVRRKFAVFRLFRALAKLARAILLWLAALPGQAAAALGVASGDQPARPGRLWKAMAIAVPAALIAAWAMPQINLVMSPSINAWAVRRAPGPIRKGDLVQFTLSHPIAGPRPVSVTKYALCMPGERLTRIETPSVGAAAGFDGHYFCNGAPLGVTLPADAHGNRLPHMEWSGIIPPGKAYVGSHHPRGFDSRYFGLVPIARLHRMERLL